MQQYAILSQFQGVWPNGKRFGNYAVFVKCNGFWQQVSPWYFSKGWAVRFAKNHNLPISFIKDL